jgi:hypothetical protein
MRPSRCRDLTRDLAVLILAVAVCRSPAFAGGPKSKPAPPEPTTVKTFKEMGYGATEDLAKRDALEKLRDDLNNWLADHHPEITYSPSMRELEVMSQFESPEPFKSPLKEKVQNERDPIAMLQIPLTAKLTNINLDYFERQTRHQLAEHRQSLLARGLAGAVALLLVGTGYLRLEEKVGRHKLKLGLVAAGVIGLVGLTLLVM